MEQIINISELINQFLIAILIGSKIFFSAIVAPNIFVSLDEKNSRLFVRSIFPKLYFWCLIISLMITIIFAFSNIVLSFFFFIISSGYFYSRQFLMHKINKISDKTHKTEMDNKSFKILHSFSVLIFVVQLILISTIYFISETQ